MKENYFTVTIVTEGVVSFILKQDIKYDEPVINRVTNMMPKITVAGFSAIRTFGAGGTDISLTIFSPLSHRGS